MVFEKFNVEFTEQCIEEMTEIYNYISTNLKEDKVAKRLIKEVNKKVLALEYSPQLYIKIGSQHYLKRNYHRMVVKNYIILYTIDYENKKVFISHMIYRKRNYL